MYHRTLRLTLFPYTTLFRSEVVLAQPITELELLAGKYLGQLSVLVIALAMTLTLPLGLASAITRTDSRSEEHTSELQSLRHLVCHLLLEKKKQYTKTSYVRI